MSLLVMDIYSPCSLALAANTTIDEAWTRLLSQESPAIYVIDDDERLLGIVPDFELLKAQLQGLATHTTLDQVMTTNLETVAPDRPVSEIAGLFREFRYDRLPVCQRGKLVGLLSRFDVICAIAESNLQVSLENTLLATSQQQANAASIPRPSFLKKTAAGFNA